MHKKNRQIKQKNNRLYFDDSHNSPFISLSWLLAFSNLLLAVSNLLLLNFLKRLLSRIKRLLRKFWSLQNLLSSL